MTNKSASGLISVARVHAELLVGTVQLVDGCQSVDAKQVMEKCSG